MKKVITTGNVNVVGVEDINETQPVFAKRSGKLVGMIVKEPRGFILRIGGSCGSNGYHVTIEKLIVTNKEFHYEFFVEDIT